MLKCKVLYVKVAVMYPVQYLCHSMKVIVGGVSAKNKCWEGHLRGRVLMVHSPASIFFRMQTHFYCLFHVVMMGLSLQNLNAL